MHVLMNVFTNVLMNVFMTILMKFNGRLSEHASQHLQLCSSVIRKVSEKKNFNHQRLSNFRVRIINIR